MAGYVRQCRASDTNSDKNQSNMPSASSELLQSKGVMRARTENQKQIAICNRAKPRGMSRLNPAVVPNTQASAKLRESESPKSNSLNGLDSVAAINVDISSVIQTLENQNSEDVEQPEQSSGSILPQQSKPAAMLSKVQAVNTRIPSGNANEFPGAGEGQAIASNDHKESKKLTKDSAEGGILNTAKDSVAHTPVREGNGTQTSQADGNRPSKPRVTFNIPEVSHGSLSITFSSLFSFSGLVCSLHITCAGFASPVEESQINWRSTT